jgi:hypothetical protein
MEDPRGSATGGDLPETIERAVEAGRRRLNAGQPNTPTHGICCPGTHSDQFPIRFAVGAIGGRRY